MELMADSTEQVYVRPLYSVDPSDVHSAKLNTVFVPPMTGLSVDEPVYTRPKVNDLLGQAKPGEALRNLLVEANATEAVWSAGDATLPGYDQGARTADRLPGRAVP
jgi:hypothetical protein